MAGKVTAVLAESNGRVYDYITSGLTAYRLGCGPAANEYATPLPLPYPP